MCHLSDGQEMPAGEAERSCSRGYSPCIFGHGRAVDIPHLHTLGSRSMRRSNTAIPTNRLRSDPALKPLLSADFPTRVTHYELFRLVTACFKTVVDHEGM